MQARSPHSTVPVNSQNRSEFTKSPAASPETASRVRGPRPLGGPAWLPRAGAYEEAVLTWHEQVAESFRRHALKAGTRCVDDGITSS
jgi:hypothetical protein